MKSGELNVIWSNSHDDRDRIKNWNSGKLCGNFKGTYVYQVFSWPHSPSKIWFILLKSAVLFLSLSTIIWVIYGTQRQNYTRGEGGLRTCHWFKNKVQQTLIEYPQ